MRQVTKVFRLFHLTPEHLYLRLKKQLAYKGATCRSSFSSYDNCHGQTEHAKVVQVAHIVHFTFHAKAKKPENDRLWQHTEITSKIAQVVYAEGCPAIQSQREEAAQVSETEK